MLKRSRRKIILALSAIIVAAATITTVFVFRKPPSKPVFLELKGPEFLESRYEHWADSTLKTMSVKDKIAQLFLIESEGLMRNVEPLQKQFESVNYGGIYYSGLNMISHASIYNSIQPEAKVPLFFALNAPFGLFELADSSLAPPEFANLTNFANDSVVKSIAYLVAGQCKALHIHLNFSNSFDKLNQSTDPAYDFAFRNFTNDLVRTSGIYEKILADSGIISVAGPFINVGSVRQNSAQLSPLEQHERGWDSARYKPFKQLADSGTQAFWVKHFPEFLSEQKRNDFLLRKPAISDSLTRTTQFAGLVFADIRTNSLQGIYSIKEACLASVMNGTDMILVRDSVEEVVRYFQNQLGKHGFTSEVLDRKVKKILMAKAWANLPNEEPLELQSLLNRYDRNYVYVYSERLYESSMVLLQDRRKLIPFRDLNKKKIAVLNVGPKKFTTFSENLNLYSPATAFSWDQSQDPGKIEKLQNGLESFSTVVVALDDRVFVDPDLKLIPFLEQLRTKKEVVIVLFGDHQKLSQLSGFDELMVTFGRSRMAERVAGQLLMGGLQFTASLPVSCTDQICYGDGLQRRKTRVHYTLPEFAGISSVHLNRIDQIIENGITAGANPGCQVAVIKNGHIIYRKSFGFHTYTKEFPVLNSDIYDLASVTKVAATTLSVMKLYDEGKLKLDTVLSAYLPGLEKSEIRNVKIRSILLHQAGFPAVPPIFRFIRAIQRYKNGGGKISASDLAPSGELDSLFGKVEVKESDTLYRFAFLDKETEEYSLPVGENIWMRNDILDSIYLQVTKTKLISPVKYKYSDMSMYIMMKVVQAISGKPIDEFASQNFYGPMGLFTMGYNPFRRFPKEEIIPTEEDKIYRKQMLHGYVHDPTASVLGGVSGHAGLFSNATDLAILMQMVLNGGSYGGRQYFSPQTTQLFTSMQPNSGRGLGWDHEYSSHNPMIADSASIFTYGHTGFTGTCVWVDPQYQLVYVFLSNRVFPTAENKKLQTMAIRQRVHQAIYDAILNK